MKLYNTLTHSVQELEPLEPPTVTLYTCGPTVYYYPHIGNWFTFVRYDTLVRALKANGLRPKWVMNITDVGHLVSDADEGEDKLEKGAKREGKTAWQVAEFYTAYFRGGLDRLNITSPDYLPRATDHIAEQIAFVQQLESKGYTYIISDGVYYDTSKFHRYADFARLDVDGQQAGSRVENNPEKRQPSDFALWKFSPSDRTRDMEWDSPWGKGFPGWHLECSVMSMKYLGNTLDIHAGGIDHIPTHHTNEIAQSEAVTGQPLAKLWLHTNHITVNGEKIAKSLGNGITLEDVEAQGYGLAVLRLHILESHYRSQSKFSWDSLAAAGNRLRDYQTFADLRFQATDSQPLDVDYRGLKEQITAAMADDLNTPEVLRLISQVSKTQAVPPSQAALPEFISFLTFLDDLLGLRLLASQDLSAVEKDLLEKRRQARGAKDWQQADALRTQIHDAGLGVNDSDDDQVWYRL
jgi:cysteinyl-tRNA synthetase